MVAPLKSYVPQKISGMMVRGFESSGTGVSNTTASQEVSEAKMMPARMVTRIFVFIGVACVFGDPKDKISVWIV